jgi:hypothetical protein
VEAALVALEPQNLLVETAGQKHLAVATMLAAVVVVLLVPAAMAVMAVLELAIHLAVEAALVQELLLLV